jgi:hypothetical protein
MSLVMSIPSTGRSELVERPMAQYTSAIFEFQLENKMKNFLLATTFLIAAATSAFAMEDGQSLFAQGKCTDKSVMGDVTYKLLLPIDCDGIVISDFRNGRALNQFIIPNGGIIGFAGPSKNKTSNQMPVDHIYFTRKTPLDVINRNTDEKGLIDHNITGDCVIDDKESMIACLVEYSKGNDNFAVQMVIKHDGNFVDVSKEMDELIKGK